MGYTTIPGVPLIRTGTWNASVGGTQPVTAADLKAMADAAADNTLDMPVIKIGHVDQRFPELGQDGEPAYGQVANVRLSDDGQTLLGDFVNVPEELAAKADSAYPYRSAEFRSNVTLKDAAGEVVRKFKKVLTAVALLGSTPPAVKGLGTVHAALSDGTALDSDAGALVAFKLGDPLSAEQLRKALLDATPGAGEVLDFTDTLYWYTTIDGDPLTGQLRYMQGTYTESQGVVEVTGEPVEVEEDPGRSFVPKQPGTQTANVPPAAPAGPQAQIDNLSTSEGGTGMATLADLFSAVEVDPPEGEDYTAIEIPDAAVEAIAQAFTDVKNSDGEDGENPVAASEAPTGSVLVSEAQFSELTASNQSMATQLAELTAARDADRRDGIINTALSEGRLHPSERDAWRTALDDNEESITTLLSQRAQVVPVNELGSAIAPEVSSMSEAREKALDDYEAQIWGAR
ncbi:phage protease [Brevibacterium moorei]|uniref:phage protease n=1 Tax=Brevibacterium moorei TaxID=2968457 RepID=UPI00211C35B7|nr:phage protease [Brevibacterium sp. 68QC2CO]MCQ9384441.1 phage protease [Brevibacterium sp. 68QC2CO]